MMIGKNLNFLSPCCIFITIDHGNLEKDIVYVAGYGGKRIIVFQQSE